MYFGEKEMFVSILYDKIIKKHTYYKRSEDIVMNFQELVASIDRDKFKEVMTNWHVEEDSQKRYLAFAEHLATLTPSKEEGELVVHKTDYGEWEDIDVYIKDGESTNAIDFLDWEVVLGYEVNQQDVNDVSPELFVYSAFYDMTFDGFEEETRNESISALEERAKTAEENGHQGLTAEQLELNINNLLSETRYRDE